MMNITTLADSDRLLSALGEQLADAGASYELVVVGGSGLLALGLVSRPTRDVDVVALREGDSLRTVDPLPEALRIARDRVARDYALPDDWLNAGPASLLDFGLPEDEELLAAARWTRTHDPSEGHRMVLGRVLSALGIDDASLGL